MLTDGTKTKVWKARWKQALIDDIIERVRVESPFVEKSEYTLETMRRVLEEEL